MKSLASKRFSEKTRQSTIEGLSVLQSRVEKASNDISKLRSDRFFAEQVRPDDQEQEGLKREDVSKNGSADGSDKHSGGKGSKGEKDKGLKKSNPVNVTPPRWRNRPWEEGKWQK